MANISIYMFKLLFRMINLLFFQVCWQHWAQLLPKYQYLFLTILGKETIISSNLLSFTHLPRLRYSQRRYFLKKIPYHSSKPTHQQQIALIFTISFFRFTHQHTIKVMFSACDSNTAINCISSLKNNYVSWI